MPDFVPELYELLSLQVTYFMYGCYLESTFYRFKKALVESCQDPTRSETLEETIESGPLCITDLFQPISNLQGVSK